MLRGGSLLFPKTVIPVSFSVQATGLADQASNPFTFTHTAAQDDAPVVDVLTTSSNPMTGVTYGGTAMRCKGIHRLTNNSWMMKYALPKVNSGNNTVSVAGVSAWAAAECISYKNASRFWVPRRARASSNSISHDTTIPANGMTQECLFSTVNQSSLAGGNTRSYRNGSSTDVSIRDAAAAATFRASLASSSVWGAHSLGILASDAEGPYYNGVWGLSAAGVGPNLQFTLPGVEAGENVCVDVVVDRAGTSISWVTVGGEDTFVLQSQTFTGISGSGIHYRFVMQASTSGDKTVSVQASNGSAWINACAVAVGGFTGTGTTVSGNGSSSVPSRAITPIGNLTILGLAMANGGSLPKVNGSVLWDSWMNNNCSIYMFVTDRAETLALTNSTNWSYIETPLY